jgi:PHP family Zn ribbon phosphoesterase
MSPRAIGENSLEKGLDIIAVCDHNSAENVGAVLRAGKQRGLNVFPGMEVSSKEEVHVLGIFSDEAKAIIFQELVYDHLQGTNRPDVFGDQVIANEFDEVEGFNDRLLIGATKLGVHEVVREIHRLGGLGIASHVDRPSFSVTSQLGFIPPDLELDALEISFKAKEREIHDTVHAVDELPIVTFSDAHFLQDIGRAYTSFMLEAPNLEEIRMALKEESGRGIEVN